MHANSVLTFSLPEIRDGLETAGAVAAFHLRCGWRQRRRYQACLGQRQRSLDRARLLADQTAGGNRRRLPGEIGPADGHPFVRSAVGTPLTGGGRTFRVNQALGPDAEYLTLVCTSAGDGIHADHGAWIGARLEAAP